MVHSALMERNMRIRMSHMRPVSAMLAVLLAVSFAYAPSSGYSQVRIPGSSASTAMADEDVASLLQKGQQLERDRRWSEAMTHYEDAARRLPDRREIQDRLTISRAHHDVTRRYSDSSFQQAVDKMSKEEATELFSEILQKIHTHYVQSPSWHDLVRRGTFMLEVALTEPAFLKRHVPNVPADQINAVRRALRAQTDAAGSRTRQEAKDHVLAASRFVHDKLGISDTALLLEYTSGAITSLDEYSTFLSGDQLDELFSQIEGNFVGLGVELKADDSTLLITNVITGSPAEKGGLRKGDRIIGVDGQSTHELSTDKAADMLKGVEGSQVNVELEDQQHAKRVVTLMRERVEVPSVDDVKIVDEDNGIGYLKLTSFQKTTSRDLDAALWKLHRSGMKSLIVDVRGNPGGLLTAAVEVSDKFLANGTIVRTKGRNASEDFDYKAHSVGTWRMPLVVMIDGDSASASEIFAGAIRDHSRGKLVGTRSYGKGSVQGIFPLSSSTAGVRLTTAKFYSPNGQPISNRGVMPDVVVRSTAKPSLDGDQDADGFDAFDAALTAAMQQARSQLSQR
ncbi:MAG: hypothetical protein RIS70_4140 [Planctomycetota bacterium]